MNSSKKIKLIGTIIGVVLFIIMIVGVTYAWISWQSGNTIISGKSGCFPTINHTNGDTLSTNNVLLYDENKILSDEGILFRDEMSYLDITASVGSDCNMDVELRIELDVTELSSAFIDGNSVGAFKYVLASYDPYDNDVSGLNGEFLEILEKGSITNTGVISIDGGELTTEAVGYLVIFYVDGDMAFNDAQNSRFAVNIVGKAVQIG